MSFPLVIWALNVDVPPHEKLVLTLLADHADQEGKCWPSQTILAHRSGLSKRTVLRALANLEGAGIITRNKRRRSDGSRSSDAVQIKTSGVPLRSRLPESVESEDAQTPYREQGDNQSPPSDSQSPGTDTLSPGTDSQSGGWCPVVTAEPVIEPINEPINEPRASADAERTSRARTDAHIEAFEQWWQGYPRKENKGRARTAFKAALKKASIQQLTEGRDAYASRVKAEGTDARYIAHASSWLNGERWADEAPGRAKTPTTPRIVGQMNF